MVVPSPICKFICLTPIASPSQWECRARCTLEERESLAETGNPAEPSYGLFCQGTDDARGR